MSLKNNGLRRGWIVVTLFALVITVACGKKQGSTTSAASGADAAAPPAVTATSNDPTTNYKLAYLSDEKIQKFIESLKEEMNPFDVVFEGGQMRSSSGIKGEVEKFNVFARKYGFKGTEDYMAVWGRITVAEAQLAAEEMTKGTKEMLEKMTADAEKSLQDPNLSPDMRKSFEEQVAGNKRALEDLTKSQASSLNEEDLKLIKKYKLQLDEATKKYKPRTEGNY